MILVADLDLDKVYKQIRLEGWLALSGMDKWDEKRCYGRGLGGLLFMSELRVDLTEKWRWFL